MPNDSKKSLNPEALQLLCNALNRLIWKCPVPSRFTGTHVLLRWAEYWIGELKNGPEAIAITGLEWDLEDSRFQLSKEALAARKKAREIPGGWTSSRRSLPDSDLTVLIHSSASDEPVWMGYHDGETWRAISGEKAKVTHWAPLPEPPQNLRK